MKQYLTTKNIIIAVLIIGIAILLFSLFGGKSTSANDKLQEALIKQMDKNNEKEEQNIVLHERIIEEKDRVIEMLQEKDSLSEVHSRQIELNYNKLNETLRNIPVRINRISSNNDSIRAAYRDF